MNGDLILPVVIILFAVLLAHIAAPWGVKVIQRRRFLAAVGASRCVCLTFDDGPHPVSTPKILDLLARADARATFFLIGEQAEKHPELVERIAREGHQIGEHSFRHTHAWKSDPFRTGMDLRRGGQTLKQFSGGAASAWLRPPYGKMNLGSLLYVWLGRRRLAFWNVDPMDYSRRSADEVARFVGDRLNPGAVILLHDGRRTSGDPQVTVDAVDAILKTSNTRDVKFATIDEAFSTGVGRSA